MFRTVCTIILPIASVVAGYLLSKVDPVAGAFAPYLACKWQLPVLLSLSLLLCVLIPFSLLKSNPDETHKDKRHTIFNAALRIINARSHITLELINEFKAVFDENKYFIKPKQKKALKCLMDDLGDVRIDDAELTDTSDSASRKTLIAHRRKLLSRIESMKPRIEKYLRKIT